MSENTEKAKKPFNKKRLIPLIVVAVILVAVLVTVLILVGNSNKQRKNGLDYASGAWDGLVSKSSVYYVNIDTAGGYKDDKAKMTYGNSAADPDLSEANFSLKVENSKDHPLGYYISFTKSGARWEDFTTLTPVTQNVALITGDKASAVRKIKENKTEKLVKENLINGKYTMAFHAGSQFSVSETLTIADNKIADGIFNAEIEYDEETDCARLDGKFSLSGSNSYIGCIAETTDDYMILCLKDDSKVGIYKFTRNK